MLDFIIPDEIKVFTAQITCMIANSGVFPICLFAEITDIVPEKTFTLNQQLIGKIPHTYRGMIR